MARTYNKELKCGCLISLDGGGGLIDCYSDDCKFDEYKDSEEYLLDIAEIKRRNP